MPVSALLQTEIHLASLLGKRDECDGYFVVRTPDNPGFYYGNMLVLKEEPREIARWEAAFRQAFGQDMAHCCISWSGEPLAEAPCADARERGFEPDRGSEMSMTAPPAARESRWTIRPLSGPEDWDASARLNTRCDVTEQTGDDSYRQFKERARAARRKWLERGLATWWAAFDGAQLVAQCGMVPCGNLGRFQVVETHPDWRSRGICSALVATVARDAFQTLGVERVLLQAEVDGPALGLYSRLGFVETGHAHSILRQDSPMRVRTEHTADHAGVRSLVNAAFGRPAESALVDALRATEGCLSLVAEQSNALLGHVLFSRVTCAGGRSHGPASALAPLAVRPVAQGRGVGSALVRAGIEHLTRAGYGLCFVVGNPDYYTRFGFVPASPHGLSNPFGIEGAPFMVLELRDGGLASAHGLVEYDSAFDAL